MRGTELSTDRPPMSGQPVVPVATRTTGTPQLHAPRARAESEARTTGRRDQKNLGHLCHTTGTTGPSVHLHTRAHTHGNEPGRPVVPVVWQVCP